MNPIDQIFNNDDMFDGINTSPHLDDCGYVRTEGGDPKHQKRLARAAKKKKGKPSSQLCHRWGR